MLNGRAPLLIFNFPLFTSGETFNAISGIPVVGDFLASNIGIPIPIYLDPDITGIQVESESKALDIDTESKQRYDGQPPEVKQRGITNLITVNLVASRTSDYLTVLLAMNDMIFSRLVSKHYNVSYINGATTIFNGLLHGFSANGDSDTDKMQITLQISKANLKATVEPPGRFFLPKITGAVPAPAAALSGGL